jgi:hypothetical protein
MFLNSWPFNNPVPVLNGNGQFMNYRISEWLLTHAAAQAACDGQVTD